NTPLGIGNTAITHFKHKLHDLLHYFKSDQMKRSDLEEFLQVSEKSVSIIFDNLSRASQLIKSFKEISVDQSGGDVREINLYDYLQQLLISLEPNFKSRLIQVDFLSIAKTIQLKLEPGALAQLLTNLIMNSLVHAFERQQKGLIKITAKTKGKNLLLRYQDNGKGIAAENLHKIFEPFFTTKRLRGGSGLGLHIVYNLVTRKFHGKIQVESELQKGVEFLIELPNCVVKK
ncbi:MAG: sensor histidine kinase, partial [Methylococcales bacterium]